jgi:hypothetical protein
VIGVRAGTRRAPGRRDPGDQPWMAEPSPVGAELNEWSELPSRRRRSPSTRCQGQRRKRPLKSGLGHREQTNPSCVRRGLYGSDARRFMSGLGKAPCRGMSGEQVGCPLQKTREAEKGWLLESQKAVRPAEAPGQCAKTQRLCQSVGPSLGQQKPPEAAGGSAKEARRFYNSLSAHPWDCSPPLRWREGRRNPRPVLAAMAHHQMRALRKPKSSQNWLTC